MEEEPPPALESPVAPLLVSIQACPRTTLRHPMRVAGLRECPEASQASAVRRGRLNLDRHSTRALTRGVPTVGKTAHATGHPPSSKGYQGPRTAVPSNRMLAGNHPGLPLKFHGRVSPPPAGCVRYSPTLGGGRACDRGRRDLACCYRRRAARSAVSHPGSRISSR